jgi:hypothetical protein
MFRIVLGGVRPPGADPIELALWIDGKQVEVKKFDPVSMASFEAYKQDMNGMRVDFKTRVSEGSHWIAASIPKLYEGLPTAYRGPNPAKRPEPPPPQFRAPRNLPPERLEELKKQFEARMADRVAANDGRISAIELGGPYAQLEGPSAEARGLFTRAVTFAANTLLDAHRPSFQISHDVLTDAPQLAKRSPICWLS